MPNGIRVRCSSRFTRASSVSLGGEPFGCLIGDYSFSHAPTDVQLLRDLSRIASSAHAPFFAAAHPHLLGMDSWNELMQPARPRQSFRYAGICGVEGSARPGRFPLYRALHAARAGAAALRREVRAGRGVRV